MCAVACAPNTGVWEWVGWGRHSTLGGFYLGFSGRGDKDAQGDPPALAVVTGEQRPAKSGDYGCSLRPRGLFFPVQQVTVVRITC